MNALILQLTNVRVIENLFNEIEKIQLYLKDKKNITNDEISKLIKLSENHSINDLINNCLAKKQKNIQYFK